MDLIPQSPVAYVVAFALDLMYQLIGPSEIWMQF